MVTKQPKSKQIASKIAELEAQLEKAKREEAEQADAELLRLVHRAGAVEELTKMMHARLEKRAE